MSCCGWGPPCCAGGGGPWCGVVSRRWRMVAPGGWRVPFVLRGRWRIVGSRRVAWEDGGWVEALVAAWRRGGAGRRPAAAGNKASPARGWGRRCRPGGRGWERGPARPLVLVPPRGGGGGGGAAAGACAAPGAGAGARAGPGRAGGAMAAAETKIIYHLDEQETPYLVKLPIPAERVTLGDFKGLLNRPNYKFYFKSMDDDFG